MKIETTKTSILNALKTTDKAIGARATLPVLQNVLLQVEDSIITLTGTNLDLYLHAQFKPTSADDGKLCLPSKKLIQIIGNLPEENITLVKQENKVKISSGSSVFHLPILNSEDFPKQPTVAGENLTVDTATLKSLLESTKDSASTDENRYILNSVMLHHEDDKLLGVSTDGRRLCLTSVEGIGEMEKTIIPLKSIGPINEVLSHGKKAKLFHQEKAIFITVEDSDGLTFSVYSKLIEGTFPNYKQVIPKNAGTSVKIGKAEIHTIISRATLVTSEKSQSVKLKFENTQITIEATSSEYGNFKETVTCENGPEQPFQMAINPEFLLTALRNAPIDDITLDVTDELSPLVVKTSSYTHVVMPLRLN
jgi:DNA polymerase-3 subunit beta